MALDHTEVVPTKSSKEGFDLKLFTDSQRSFAMTDLTTDEMLRIAQDIHKFLGVCMWLVTVKIPKNPDHLLALRCKHKKYGTEGHCAELGCPNYVSGCPKHGYGSYNDDRCTRDKVTAACPWSPYCTDKTGEHHTFLVYAFTDGEARDKAENEMVARGYETHITRIELVPGDS